MRVWSVVVLAGLMVSAAGAQEPEKAPAMMMLGSDGAVVTAQPYHVIEKITTTKTLSDGTTLTHARQEEKWRDSAGRFRKQTAVVKPDGTVEVQRAEIFDPTSHTLTTLEMGQKRAVVLHMPEGDQAAQMARLLDCLCRLQVRPGVQVRTEALPTKYFANVAGVGKRTTKVRPPGTVGNDREIVSTSERYDSPELHILLYSSLDDPREKMVREVTTLERAEPDVAMFQVPAEFTTRDVPVRQGQ
jgi:hypothetical protein